MKTLDKPHSYWNEVSDETFVRDFRRNLCEKFPMKPLNAVMLSESFTCIEHTTAEEPILRGRHGPSGKNRVRVRVRRPISPFAWRADQKPRRGRPWQRTKSELHWQFPIVRIVILVVDPHPHENERIKARLGVHEDYTGSFFNDGSDLVWWNRSGGFFGQWSQPRTLIYPPGLRYWGGDHRSWSDLDFRHRGPHCPRPGSSYPHRGKVSLLEIWLGSVMVVG